MIRRTTEIAAVGGLFFLLALPAARAGEQEDWALHGQSTFVDQYHPAFTSPYRGVNSLDPGSRGNEVFAATAYGGLRVWEGGEAWADAEVDQGFGLSNTVGVAAFPNGEGYKIGSSDPYFRLHRLFLRQRFDLGGESEDITPAANQLGGSQSADDLAITIGKFAVTDIFDTNDYAHDPSQDFFNWAVIDAGAFDYAADSWGYSYGLAGDLSEGDYSFRAGLFDMSRVPNGPALVRGLGQYQLDAEVERRFQLFGQDGKIKLLGWMSRAAMGSYNDALALAAATHQIPSTALVRIPRSRPGASFNLQQGLSGDMGFFLRASMADGSQESFEFTDMDQSLSTGLSLKGDSWARKDDTVGLALETGAVSKAARRYFAAGGLGTLVGDGKLLHYRPENVMEAYYSAALFDAAALSLDYQFIANPAYNADRGPVSVLGFRLHAQF
jgi:high affinity Mn2+ porin